MSETNKELGFQLLDTKFKVLERSPKPFYQKGTKIVPWFSGGTNEVALMGSICPHCEGETEWTTTGLLPGSLLCEKCKKSFLI